MATTVARLQAVLGVDDRDFVRGLTAAHASMSRSGAMITAGALAVGAGVAVIGKKSIDAAADFEKSMNVLQSVSGATKDQLEDLSKMARRLGADTKLPGTSAKDASEAMTELAKAGFSVGQVMDSTRSTLLLSAAAEVSNARAAEIAANAVNAFGIKAKRTNIVVDQLANVANASSVSMDQAADSMQMASAVFSGFQKPTLGAEGALRELNIAIGQLGNAGIKGSDAGTSLKQALLQLTAPANRTKRMMTMLAEEAGLAAEGQHVLTSAAGLSGKEFDALTEKMAKSAAGLSIQGDIAFTAEGKMRPLHEIVEMMTAATARMTDETKAYYVTQIFGADASRAILALMQQGEAGYNKMAAAIDKSGSAQEVANAKMKGYKGTMEALRSSVETLQIELGLMLLPAVTRVAQAMVQATTVMQQNTTATKILFVAIGALTTALIAAKVAQLLLNLAVLANPYVAAGAAVIAFTVLIVILWRRFEDARDAIVLFVARFSPLAALFLLVKHRGDDIVEMFNKFKETPPMEALTKVFNGWAAALDKVVDFLKAVWSLINKIADKIPDLPSLPWRGGDPRDPSMTLPPQGPVGSGPLDISPSLWDDLASARRFGLTLQSGYRPGAITKSGKPSDHGRYPSHAIDVGNGVNTPQMAAFFSSLIGDRSIKQAFYDPLGSIFGGVLSSYREGGHMNHVHVATYDKGGWLQPGLTLAANYTGRPEPVGMGAGVVNFNFPNYVGSKTELMGWLQNAAAEFKRRNGRGAF